jgi:hypothetical protein
LLRRKDGKLIDVEVSMKMARLSGDEFLVVAVSTVTDRDGVCCFFGQAARC